MISAEQWRRLRKWRLVLAVLYILFLGVVPAVIAIIHNSSDRIVNSVIYTILGLIFLPNWARRVVVPALFTLVGVIKLLACTAASSDLVCVLDNRVGGPAFIVVGIVAGLYELSVWRRESRAV